MTRRRGQTHIRDMNVIDMVLIDHRHIKECIEILIDEKKTKSEKLSVSHSFLDSLQKHSAAEKEVIYAPLESEEEFHFSILEAQIEHGMIEEKTRLLKPKISRARVLKDELEAELKVLAEVVKHHIKEEESELLPRMNSELDEDMLKEMGKVFMELRKISAAELNDYPQLQDELIIWKDDVQKVSSQFLSKMDKYVENLKH